MAAALEPIPIFVTGDSGFAKQLRAAARSNPRFELLSIGDPVAADSGQAPRMGLIEFDIEDDASVAALSKTYPGAGLILFGRLRAADRIARALERGGGHVLEYMPLPALETNGDSEKYIMGYVLPHVRNLARALPASQGPDSTAPDSPGATSLPRPANRDRSQLSGRFDLCAIGVSAGGPRALGKLLDLLPGSLNGGIIIAQHMPQGFTAQLAQSLNKSARLEVLEARDGMNVERGTVFLAPGGKHTTVRRRGDRIYLRVEDGPPHNHCQPSIDLLFRSLAQVIPTRTLAILMTGMGADGCEGLRELKAARAYSLAQNEASCTIFGIPARAIEAGLIDEVLSIEGLADRVAACLGSYDAARADARR
ncbi:MAG: CheB methylesterase domain-containing protein [Leptospirales bacterium]|jgi:two-component system chemotaxis response regulator CheB